MSLSGRRVNPAARLIFRKFERRSFMKTGMVCFVVMAACACAQTATGETPVAPVGRAALFTASAPSFLARAVSSALEGRPRFFFGALDDAEASFLELVFAAAAGTAASDFLSTSALILYLLLQPGNEPLGFVPQMFGCGVVHHGVMASSRFFGHGPLSRETCLRVRTRITA